MASWKPLPTKRRNADASLYVKTLVVESSYAIYLTDLTHIWLEKLDRRAIMRRAMDENTTIDPTNGPDQLKHLLDHIEKCLHGDSGTRVVFSSKSDMQTLKLTLTSKLPAPLEPLRWPVTLKLDGQASFSAELLLPALTSLQDYRQAVDGLVSVIKEKDNVIQKLQDKLEVTGVDLRAVFPGFGLSKASKPSTADYHRKVPGLKEFLYESWAQHAPGLHRDPIAHDHSPRLVGANGLSVDPWWENLPASDAEDEDLVPDSQAKSNSGTQFSVPERKKSPRKGSRSSTSTEEDGPAPSTERYSPRNSPASREVVAESLEEPNLFGPEVDLAEGKDSVKHPKNRIGKLGGKTASSGPAPAVSPSDPAPVTTGQQISPPKKLSKLGKIGGASKNSEAADSPSKLQAAQAETSTEATVKREFSLGDDPGQDANHDARAERETSEDRANRRRTELKRQMEEKKKVSGTKKKQRKF